jgi:hypothetical protein
MGTPQPEVTPEKLIFFSLTFVPGTGLCFAPCRNESTQGRFNSIDASPLLGRKKYGGKILGALKLKSTIAKFAKMKSTQGKKRGSAESNWSNI